MKTFLAVLWLSDPLSGENGRMLPFSSAFAPRRPADIAPISEAFARH